jgi:hypothetical protein
MELTGAVEGMLPLISLYVYDAQDPICTIEGLGNWTQLLTEGDIVTMDTDGARRFTATKRHHKNKHGVCAG